VAKIKISPGVLVAWGFSGDRVGFGYIGFGWIKYGRGAS